MLQNQQAASPRPWLLFALVFAATLGLDLASKQWVWTHLRPPAGEPWVVWEGVLELGFAFNRGTAFSVIREVENPLVFLPITALVLAWVGYTVDKIGHGRLRFVGLGLVVGGALGNLHDRMFRVDAFGDHGVVDFIVVHYPWGGSWPSFNLADSALVVGTAILVWALRKLPDPS
ncbi:signal peptidase II [Nannocystaceae bacterium ST9]